MKGSTLAVVVVVGLGVVGYAVYEVTNRRDRPERRTPRKVDADDAERDARPDRPRSSPIRSEDPDPPSRRGGSPRPKPKPPPKIEIPPPPPKPENLEEARERFDAWVAEVDEEIQKQKLGAESPSEEKYRLYKIKGHHAIDGILHQLDHTDPEEMKEFKEKQEIAHKKLEEMKYTGG